MPQFSPQTQAPAPLYKDIIGDPGFGPELGPHAGWLQQAAAQADAAIPGRGSVVGTRRHTVFQRIVDSWGDPRLRTEVSYYNRRLAPYRGYPGSVRLDVVEYDAAGNIIAVYDYKSGSATLTTSRIAEIRSHLPGYAQGVPIIEITGR